MQIHIIVLASIASLASAVPVSINRVLAKRGIFDNLSHFPFLASSSSAHGSSSSSSHGSSSSSDHDHDYEFNDFHHDTIPDFHSHHSHSHVIHHPELDGHSDDFSHDHNVAVSYQNQYFGYDHHDHELPASYQHQHLFDNHLSTHDDDDFQKYGSDSLLEYSHLDAPEYVGDYKNYGGNLEEYSHHAGLLDVSTDHKIDHLLDPFSPSHSSYDSY